MSTSTSSKWATFRYANTSRLDIVSPNTDAPSVREDLQRAYDHLWINGVKLAGIASKYDDFKKNGDDKFFFEEKILQDFKGTPEQKKAAVAYLMQTFHQGGLLFPVSNALPFLLVDKTGESLAAIADDSLDREMYIKTTKSGFVVQEFCAITKVKRLDDLTTIEPPQGCDAVIKAQATISVDFTKEEEPVLTVESNQMEIYAPFLKATIDHRSFLQMLIDYLSKLIGYNKVPPIVCSEISEAPSPSPNRP